jgi:hypothetical protein
MSLEVVANVWLPTPQMSQGTYDYRSIFMVHEANFCPRSLIHSSSQSFAFFAFGLILQCAQEEPFVPGF